MGNLQQKYVITYMFIVPGRCVVDLTLSSSSSPEFGWGGGIEATGVTPDIVVDNDPHLTFNGEDRQLERAILELRNMLDQDPIEKFKAPSPRPDTSLDQDSICET